ncbi:MAG TPA: DUF5010 domain-containing protein [Verrucomicrobiae bacterium]|nr:DUF5010 domain-containing protein [Verrucomicrobiae bacterium]
MLLIVANVQAQYLGVTCGYQYSAQLTGPLSDPNQFNISLYNPQSSNPNATWDNWAEQLGQAGVDFVCPNLTGTKPNNGGNPTNIIPFMAALSRRGLANQIKFAIFDDNAASWVAQWNEANGRGYGYADKFDMSDTNNWKYLYDYNYKLFYQTVPDTNRFKIKGRPLLIIWTGNTVTFLTNTQGNVSRALTYVRQKCQADFGFNPYIVLSSDFFSNDTTCNNPGIADASESWFTAGPNGPSHTLVTKNGVKVGVAVAEFQHTGQSGFLDPNHGQLFTTGLTQTVGANALLTLCEGFTDYEEDAAQFRVRNLDAQSNALTYSQTLYDYPNQRLNILRQFSVRPFPAEMKFEAEGCDTFGGAASGNGKSNFYRNGNIAIEPTTDAGGGFDIGWIQAGEWFEWTGVPIQGSQVHLRVRVASPNNGCQLHFVIDGTNYPAMTVPNTGGNQSWATVESASSYTFAKNSVHNVMLICDTGGFNLNYWQYHDDIPIGANINLRSSASGKWVTASNSTLNANAASPGTNEAFTVVDASASFGYGSVALLAANNQYVTADTNGILPLSANASSIGSMQVFDWVDNGNGTIYLRALANSLMVSATNSSSAYPLVPNRVRFNAGTPETFAVTQVSANSLSFVAQPNNSAEGLSITAGGLNEVQLAAADANQNPITGLTITLSIASGDGTLTGNTAVTDVNGIAHFNNLIINLIGAKTLLASGASVQPVTSSAFQITPGAPASLSIESAADGSGSPVAASLIVAGTSLNVFAISRDSGGNFITNSAATWSLVNITGGVLARDLVSSADDRSAAFTGHALGSAKIQADEALVAQSGLVTVIGVPVSFTSGTFSNNSVLNLVGNNATQLYGVSLGDGTAHSTANGFKFGSFPSTNLSYGSSSAYSVSGFLSGATSGDANFDTVLNDAELGIGNGVITLSNLVVGMTYKVLFLESDTRTGVGTRNFTIVSGASSAAQSYAFVSGVPALGGYIEATLLATAATQSFTNTQAGYGYQLNAVLIGAVPPPTPAVITAAIVSGSSIHFAGTNGVANGTYRVLTSTNAMLPLVNWTAVLTNSFDASGAFSNSIPINLNEPGRFYRLVEP